MSSFFQESVLNSESITRRNSGSKSRACDGKGKKGTVSDEEKRTGWTVVLHKNLLCAGNMVTKHNLFPCSGCDSITTTRPLHPISCLEIMLEMTFLEEALQEILLIAIEKNENPKLPVSRDANRFEGHGER